MILDLYKLFNTPPKEQGEYLGVKWLHDLVFYIQLDYIDEEQCTKLDLKKTDKGYLVHPQMNIKVYIQNKQYYFQIIETIIDTSYDIGGTHFLESLKNIDFLLSS